MRKARVFGQETVVQARGRISANNGLRTEWKKKMTELPLRGSVSKDL